MLCRKYNAKVTYIYNFQTYIALFPLWQKVSEVCLLLFTILLLKKYAYILSESPPAPGFLL